MNSLHFSLSLLGARDVIYGEIKDHLGQNEATLSHSVFITGATQALSKHQPLSHPSFKRRYFPPCAQNSYTQRYTSPVHPSSSSVIFSSRCLLFRSLFPLCLLLEEASISLALISFVVKAAFLWHLSQAFVSSTGSLTDYLLCFPLILIRSFHGEHQTASWLICIMGRTPQGKCKQAPIKLSIVSSITHTRTHAHARQFKEALVSLNSKISTYHCVSFTISSPFKTISAFIINCQQDINHTFSSLE